MIIDYSVRLIVIDSFCGAGGVTEGFHRAVDELGNKICRVIIGINHDEVAIKSHAANHPDTIHFTEDFTTLDAKRLVPIVNHAKVKYPNAKILFWASAECTHHSKAKGGLPRNADSRSLPEHIERYAEVLKPHIIGVENVIEFLDWGPLDENGKPIREQKGIYYREWRDTLINFGYLYDYRKLNAADYGAYTSRIRYFGIFSKTAENIAFPVQSHSKTSANGLERWKAVKDVLDLDIEGESIFGRKKPLVDPTLERVIAGIERFVIHGENDFMLKYNSMSQRKTYKAPSINEPSPTVSCQSRIGLVKAKFISKAFSGRPQHKNQSINTPAGSITTVDHHQLLTAYYGNGYNSSIEEPAGTITTKDRFALVTSKFMDQQYGMRKPVGINQPLGCLTANPKFNLVTAKWLMDTQFKNKGRSINEPGPTITANRKQFYLMNPQFNNKGGSIDKPCFTLIARMDKAPPYLVEVRKGEYQIKINDSDSDVMVRLKTLCNQHGIIDVMMRMLMIDELLRIQGFGDAYVLKGTKAEMKKFIGNAVECNQAKVLAEAIAKTIHINVMKQAL
ncbi:MAG: DNA cytosine methyltransferase [Paludibacter sp.]|nr:DNA cytosine methyltransferase [Paludibacter sp.]